MILIFQHVPETKKEPDARPCTKIHVCFTTEACITEACRLAGQGTSGSVHPGPCSRAGVFIQVRRVINCVSGLPATLDYALQPGYQALGRADSAALPPQGYRGVGMGELISPSHQDLSRGGESKLLCRLGVDSGIPRPVRSHLIAFAAIQYCSHHS